MSLVDLRRVLVGAFVSLIAAGGGACATAGSDSGGSDFADARESPFIDADLTVADANPLAPDAAPGSPDATPPPPPDASPPDAMPPPTELGRIGYWYGKVNIHKAPGGVWMEDPDCSSGGDIDTLAYCRKWWPATVSVTEVAVTPKPTPIWYSGSCLAVYPGDGLNEYTCNPI